uniref:Solute carrier family 22 member 13 n=1 Tax=Leptobrachium leishanense TaxID=445787 RepID=A0A8C5Q4R2_9ANUR
MTDFGEILRNVGEFGLFQKCMVLMMSFVSVFNAFHMFGQIFLSISVPHHCNTTWILEKSPNLTEDKLLNLTVPKNAEGAFEKCLMYTPVDWDIETIEKYGLNDTEGCRDGWLYDTSEQKSTLVTEFDLVCGKREQIDIAQSIFMVGLLIGAVIFGYVGDRPGESSTSGVTLFKIEFPFYDTPSLCVIILGNNVYSFLDVVTEWVGSPRRAFATVIGHVSFAMGQMILAGVGYAVRNWRLLQIIGSVPTALLFFYIWVFPESPRWLITKGKYKEAKKVLHRAASMNKKTFSEELLSQIHEENTSKKGNILDLFRKRYLRKIALIMGFVWFVNSLVYYGLSLNIGSFGLDIYLTQLIFGAVEIPARLGAVFLVQIFGRKFSQVGCLLLGGIVCLIVTGIPKDLPIVITSLAVIGKFAIASSFSICYVYAAELFPTIIRQSGVGFCSTLARVAGIISPLITLLTRYHSAIPMAIFGSGPVIGGLLCFLLPETLNKDLQDHTAENDVNQR